MEVDEADGARNAGDSGGGGRGRDCDGALFTAQEGGRAWACEELVGRDGASGTWLTLGSRHIRLGR